MFDLTITFDNGPSPDITPGVLSTLQARSLKTTFFVVGEKLASDAGQQIAQDAHAEGHRIANHTFTHSVPLGENPAADAAETEIGRTERVLDELGLSERVFRPFGGGGNLDKRLLSRPVTNYLQANRFTCVLWNSIPRDWADPDGWVDRALEQCRSQPWSLMVLHDLPTGAMRHLETFLDRAADLGARFRSEFPDDCVPIRDGEPVRDLAPYTSDVIR